MKRTGDDTLEHAHSVLNSLRAIIRSMRVADRAGLKEHGVGSAQLYVLHELNRESPLSVNDLAERTATDQSTVSVVVTKLIDKGFVSRERSENDARKLELALTAKGRRAVKSLPPPIQSAIVEGVQRLPRARARTLAESLSAICEILGVDDEHPPMLFADDPKPARKRKAPASKK